MNTIKVDVKELRAQMRGLRILADSLTDEAAFIEGIAADLPVAWEGESAAATLLSLETRKSNLDALAGDVRQLADKIGEIADEYERTNVELANEISAFEAGTI